MGYDKERYRQKLCASIFKITGVPLYHVIDIDILRDVENMAWRNLRGSCPDGQLDAVLDALSE